MGSWSIWHWLVVLVIVVVVFGTKRLRNIGGDLGGALRDFKKGLQGDDSQQQLKADPPASADPAATEKNKDSVQ